MVVFADVGMEEDVEFAEFGDVEFFAGIGLFGRLGIGSES